MFSTRFQRPVVISTHAKIRMAERDISEVLLLEVIDSGETRFKDESHLWSFKESPARHDNIVVRGFGIGRLRGR